MEDKIEVQICLYSLPVIQEEPAYSSNSAYRSRFTRRGRRNVTMLNDENGNGINKEETFDGKNGEENKPQVTDKQFPEAPYLTRTTSGSPISSSSLKVLPPIGISHQVGK